MSKVSDLEKEISDLDYRINAAKQILPVRQSEFNGK